MDLEEKVKLGKRVCDTLGGKSEEAEFFLGDVVSFLRDKLGNLFSHTIHVVVSKLGCELFVGMLVSEVILKSSSNVLCFLNDARTEILIRFADSKGI